MPVKSISRDLPLPRAFYDRHPRVVASALLGKILVRRLPDGSLLRGRIVETEAYLGREEKDAAAHSYGGITARNAVIFGPPGHAYVYFTYGMHYCTNISCQPEGRAGCILLRALEPLEGIEAMAENRQIDLQESASIAMRRLIAAGPGRLSQAFHITREQDNGKDVTSAESDLIVTEDDYRVRRVLTTPRVGIRKSVDLPLRFLIAENAYVSGRRSNLTGRSDNFPARRPESALLQRK